ncbi:methyl-accepting chemotaxis protein [Paenibacillus sp. J22TS3]|uniref:methyl-accepting chemotaxis protein n=1 Tax=Paenibacillus sp. J22TS3 TaxID=2807192 RepID=UPI001B2B1718|nr:methyl-accepting chemotaxis protein [Paenibacillus sp. J22TS3]GIP21300.1 methyl-accepting chemotaxis protein [Paenibacillus sp. J22TS3]
MRTTQKKASNPEIFTRSKMKLGTKLGITMISLVLIPALVIVFTLRLFINDSSKEMFQNFTEKQVNLAKENMNMYFHNLEEDIQYMSSMPLMSKLDTLPSMLKYEKGADVPTTYWKPDMAGGDIYQQFEMYAKAKPNTSYVYIGSTLGAYMQWPKQDTMKGGYDPRLRPWYTISINDPSKVHYTEPYMSSNSDSKKVNLFVSSTKAITDRKGKAVGVLGIDADFNQLSQEVSKMKIGETGFLFLTTSNGTILAHPDSKLIFKKLEEIQPGASAAGTKGTEDGKSEAAPVVYSIDHLKDMMALKKDAVMETSINGEDYYIFRTTVDVTGWSMYAAVTKKEVGAFANDTTWYIGIVTLITLVLSTLVSLWMTRRLTKPIVSLSGAVSRISAGELTIEDVKVHSGDEIGELSVNVNLMKNQLRDLLSSVSNSSEHVSSTSNNLALITHETSLASEQMANSFQSVAETSQEQTKISADSLAEARQMTNQVDEVVTVIHGLRTATQETKETATAGTSVVTKTKQQMEIINTKSMTVKDLVGSLDDKSQEINHILELISEIAEQTNLLSLNASIEAARAGEAGRGFDVVAGEIRKLAERSAQSVSQIRGIVSEIQVHASEASEAVQANSQAVTEGLDLVKVAEQSFSHIAQSIVTVDDQTVEAAATIDAIQMGIERLQRQFEAIQSFASNASDSVSEVAAVSEEQAASIEEIAAAANSLAELSVVLNEKIGKFKV